MYAGRKSGIEPSSLIDHKSYGRWSKDPLYHSVLFYTDPSDVLCLASKIIPNLFVPVPSDLFNAFSLLAYLSRGRKVTTAIFFSFHWLHFLIVPNFQKMIGYGAKLPTSYKGRCSEWGSAITMVISILSIFAKTISYYTATLSSMRTTTWCGTSPWSDPTHYEIEKFDWLRNHRRH